MDAVKKIEPHGDFGVYLGDVLPFLSYLLTIELLRSLAVLLSEHISPDQIWRTVVGSQRPMAKRCRHILPCLHASFHIDHCYQRCRLSGYRRWSHRCILSYPYYPSSPILILPRTWCCEAPPPDQRTFMAHSRLQRSARRSRLDGHHTGGIRMQPNPPDEPFSDRSASSTTSAATSSSPTTNTSMTASTKPCQTIPTGTTTSASPTSATKVSGSPSLSKTTSPCFPKTIRSYAWRA